MQKERYMPFMNGYTNPIANAATVGSKNSGNHLRMVPLSILPFTARLCRFFGFFCSIQTSFILSEIRRAALFLIIHNFVRFFQSSAEEVKFSSGSGLGGQMPAQKEVDMD